MDRERDRAPVHAHAGTEVAASPKTVWDTLTDLDSWPDWMPRVRSISTSGPVEVGTTFTWNVGSTTIRSEVIESVPPRAIAWKGRMLGVNAVHRWSFQSCDGGTLVDTDEEWRGPLARLLRPIMQRSLSNAIAEGLEALKERAEGGV